MRGLPNVKEGKTREALDRRPELKPPSQRAPYLNDISPINSARGGAQPAPIR